MSEHSDVSYASFYIFGRRSVAEALRSDKPIEKIFLEWGLREDGIKDILSLARQKKIPVVNAERRKFQALIKEAEAGTHAQGVIALAPHYNYYEPDVLLTDALAQSPQPLIVALDELSDPHNLGAIARSIECSGGFGLLLPMHNSAPITPASMKTSAGALNYLPVAKCTNLNTTLIKAKEMGYWIIGTDLESTHPYTAKLYDRPVILVIGSEGDGMRPSTKKLCDALLNIPMKGQIQSLNASVAAGVVLFEIARQRAVMS